MVLTHIAWAAIVASVFRVSYDLQVRVWHAVHASCFICKYLGIESMKKVVLKILIGALVIAIIALCGGWQYLSTKRKEYKQQLENTINDKYLEGENAIGAYYYNKLHNDSTEIYKVSSFSFDQLSWMLVSRTSIWEGQYFDNTEIITKMMRSGIYKWYDFNNCTTTFSPFMIIVKTTNRGYDIIGEYILGIGLTNLYPDYFITQRSSKFNWGKLSNNKEVISYSYKIKPDMINSYFEYLKNNKYKGITIRNEVTKGYNSFEKNIKFDMLNSLVMKGACPQDSSLYFRVNKYFELKFDNDFIDMGTHPIIWETSSYGNDAYTVFTRTVTMHYSIQENKEVLETEYKGKVILWIVVLEVIYLLLSVAILKKNNIV